MPGFIHLLFIAGDHGVFAQCLDYDVAAQGATLEEAEAAFFRTVRLQLQLDQLSGRAPFAGLGKAPLKYWHMAETVSEWRRRESLDLMDVPPACVIAAQLEQVPERSSMHRVVTARR